MKRKMIVAVMTLLISSSAYGDTNCKLVTKSETTSYGDVSLEIQCKPGSFITTLLCDDADSRALKDTRTGVCNFSVNNGCEDNAEGVCEDILDGDPVTFTAQAICCTKR